MVRYTIWTPSEETESALSKIMEEIPSYYRATTEQLDEFGKKLMESGAIGYSRYEVWGVGTGPEKPGYFWAISADPASQDGLSRKKLFEIFSEVFGKKDSIYLEEIHVPKAETR